MPDPQLLLAAIFAWIGWFSAVALAVSTGFRRSQYAGAPGVPASLTFATAVGWCIVIGGFFALSWLSYEAFAVSSSFQVIANGLFTLGFVAWMLVMFPVQLLLWFIGRRSKARNRN